MYLSLCGQFIIMTSLNLIAYLFYGLITAFITLRVGWICYKNGIYFIEEEMKDRLLADSINKLLLTGYYLLNLGYATLMIYTWQHVDTITELVSSISSRSAWIILSLGLMHFFNILVIYLLRRHRHNSSQSKT